MREIFPARTRLADASYMPCIWDGIAFYCELENKVSLEFVEGLNNRIRVIQRRAYGLRDDEYRWRRSTSTGRASASPVVLRLLQGCSVSA